MRSPAFQFYPADYLADMRVRMLSWASRGLYIDLLCYCWREGYIPSDSSAIAQLCHCHDLAIVEPCLSLFQPDENDPEKLIHKRLNEEREKQIAFREERKLSGIKGSQKRWKRNSSAIKQPLAKNSSSSSSSSSSSDIPPNPQGGFCLELPESRKPDPDQIAIGKMLGRRESTKWTATELKLLKAIKPIDPEDMELMRQFYRSTEIPKESDYRRTTVERLLKHWSGELDKARIFKANQ